MEQVELEDEFAEQHQLLEAGNIAELVEQLSEMPTVEVAEFILSLDDDQALFIFNAFTPENKGYVFGSLPIDRQLEMLHQFAPRETARLFSNISSDDRADLFQSMEHDDQERLLPFLSKSVRDNVIQLSSYPEDTAGGSMSSEFASVTTDMTVDQALDQVRKDAPKKETIYYIYVVDQDRQLKGFISLKDLILAQPHEVIETIYHEEIVSVHVDDDQETVAETISKYDLIAVPVVNKENQLVGIVTHDDAIDIIREEDTEDLQKMGGMEALDEPYMNLSIWEMIKKRAGWLMILLLGGSLTASALNYYQAEITAAVVLTLFIPLIIASGGNSGSQASTLVIRALALNEISIADWWRIVKREFFTGIMLGLILGVIGFVRVYLWALTETSGDTQWVLIGLTVAISLVGVVLWGSLAGSVLPLLLKKAGLDPAVSSAPFISTLVDVTGLIIYFTIAILLLKGILL